MDLYAFRVYMVEGFYIVTYALGIYLLNQLILFLTPKVDPALSNDSDVYTFAKIERA